MNAINTKEQWQWSFIEACENGDLGAVRELCRAKKRKIAELHHEDELGFCLACSKRHLEIVKFLTRSEELRKEGFKPINLHGKNKEGLIMACFLGQLKMVEFLTSSAELKSAGLERADLKAQKGAGLTWAIAKGNFEIVQYWMERLDFKEMKTRDQEFWRMAVEDGLEIALEKEGFNKIERTIEYCFGKSELGRIDRKDREWQDWKYWRSACKGGKRENIKWLIMRKDFKVTQTMKQKSMQKSLIKKNQWRRKSQIVRLKEKGGLNIT